MRIRTKIAIYFAPFILLTVCAIYLLNYSVVRRDLAEKAHQELAMTEQSMHRAAQALLSGAISNYLRGITEKNMDFIRSKYAAFERGVVSEEEAKGAVQAYFDHQGVGDSGYMVAVEAADDRLYLDLHPYLKGVDCTDTEGCRAWYTTKNGYTEYDWRNPADNSFRKKAAYVQEFEPWNWIVGASSYRDEFVKLVRVEELRQLLEPVRINETGYFLVFDEERNLLIHPEYEKLSGQQIVNSSGENILDLFSQSEDGYVTYLWKNPSDTKERLKYAFVDKLEGYNWYLVATGYLSEVYEPIRYIEKLTLVMVILAGAILATIIIRVARTIARPLNTLEHGVTAFYTNRTALDWQGSSVSEIDILGDAFGRMMVELNSSLHDLEEKNRELADSEQEKEQNRRYLDSIINSMPSVIVGVDPDMTVTLWNSQAESVLEVSLAEALGESLFDVCSGLVEHKQLFERALAKSRVLSLPMSSEFGGTLRYMEITVYPLMASTNQGAVIRIDEVTDRVEMEQRLRQSQKMDAVGQLAGGVAHDFNNMLSGITGAAELLRLKVRDDELRLVQIISDASGRAAELIQKLLAFSRKEKVALSPVDVHNIIGNTLEILERTLHKRISIVSSLEAESATVMGDWSQLQNSLLNIGINGGHAMVEGGSLVFSTSVIFLDSVDCSSSPFDLSPGPFLQISVRDEGCGISKENIKRIFEPFFTTREQDQGTGLGLAAVYGAVLQHHGSITVYSELGVGTEFKICLPLSGESEEVQLQVKEPVTGHGGILVIDDEELVRITARLMLEKLGYTVFEASNGSQGLEMYRSNQTRIDLVLLDMLMPVMDGTDCFHGLQEINPAVRVVISSGFTRDADLTSLRNRGLCDFVRKPYNMADLSEVLSRALT